MGDLPTELRSLAADDEWLKAAEAMERAADEIERLEAEIAELRRQLRAKDSQMLTDIRLAWRSGERPEDYPHLFD